MEDFEGEHTQLAMDGCMALDMDAMDGCMALDMDAIEGCMDAIG